MNLPPTTETIFANMQKKKTHDFKKDFFTLEYLGKN